MEILCRSIHKYRGTLLIRVLSACPYEEGSQNKRHLTGCMKCFIFIGRFTVRFGLSDYKVFVIGQVKSDSLDLRQPFTP